MEAHSVQSVMVRKNNWMGFPENVNLPRHGCLFRGSCPILQTSIDPFELSVLHSFLVNQLLAWKWFLTGVLFHPCDKLEHFQQCNGIRIELDLLGLPLVQRLRLLYIYLVSDCKCA